LRGSDINSNRKFYKFSDTHIPLKVKHVKGDEKRSKMIRVEDYLNTLSESDRYFAQLKIRVLSWGRRRFLKDIRRTLPKVEPGIQKLFRALNLCRYSFTASSCEGHIDEEGPPWYKLNPSLKFWMMYRMSDEMWVQVGWIDGFYMEEHGGEFKALLREAARDLPCIVCEFTSTWFRITAKPPSENISTEEFYQEMRREFDIMGERLESWIVERGLVDEFFAKVLQ
jgi:hypothetical protein